MALDDPYSYCKNTILKDGEFPLWNNATADSACVESEKALYSHCGVSVNAETGIADTSVVSEDCDPCAYLISYLYSKYDAYVV